MTKILIIDDDPVIRTLLSDFLSSKTYQVELADSAKAGLDSFEQLNPELVLLDYQLPDANGIEVLQKIRASASKVKVIMFSANNDTQKLVEAKQIHADAYMQKPFELKDLLQVIRETFD